MTSRFTRPDRSDYRPNRQKTEDNDSIDFGWNEGVLSDGRAYRVEAWAQDGITSLSIFMPVAGIETMSNAGFVELLEREGLIAWEPGSTKSAYARPVVDASGNAVWSVNVVMAMEDSAVATDTFRLLPYQDPDAEPETMPRRDLAAHADGDEDDIADLELPGEDDDLGEFSLDPDMLTAWGYVRLEEDTTSPVRWVRYTKTIQDSAWQLRFDVSIEFELGISDEPHRTYTQARSYAFNGVQLAVYTRQMERLDNVCYDEDTERPSMLDSVKLGVTTLRGVEELIARMAPATEHLW